MQPFRNPRRRAHASPAGGSNGGHRQRRARLPLPSRPMSAPVLPPRRPPWARRSATKSTPQPRRVCSPATSARAGSPAPAPNSPTWITSGFRRSSLPPFGSSSSSSFATRSSRPSIATSDGWQSAIRSRSSSSYDVQLPRADRRRVHGPDRDLERFLDLHGDPGDRPRLPGLQRRARRDRRARADDTAREPRLGRAPRLHAARASRRPDHDRRAHRDRRRYFSELYGPLDRRGRKIFVPNTKMVSTTLVNRSVDDPRRLVTVQLRYGSAHVWATRRITLEAAAQIPHVPTSTSRSRSASSRPSRLAQRRRPCAVRGQASRSSEARFAGTRSPRLRRPSSFQPDGVAPNTSRQGHVSGLTRAPLHAVASPCASGSDSSFLACCSRSDGFARASRRTPARPPRACTVAPRRGRTAQLDHAALALGEGGEREARHPRVAARGRRCRRATRPARRERSRPERESSSSPIGFSTRSASATCGGSRGPRRGDLEARRRSPRTRARDRAAERAGARCARPCSASRPCARGCGSCAPCP